MDKAPGSKPNNDDMTDREAANPKREGVEDDRETQDPRPAAKKSGGDRRFGDKVKEVCKERGSQKG